MHEAYDNGCDETTAIHGYSATKSIVSLLFGIALDAGYFNREKGLVVAIASLFKLQAKDRIDFAGIRAESAFA